MLIRISLIVAIIAGLAVTGLNFVKVKEKITTIQAERENERSLKETAQNELAKTRKELDETTAAITEEKDRALAEVASQTRRADKLTTELNNTRRERDDAQAELARYRGTDLSVDQILAIKKSYKGLQDE